MLCFTSISHSFVANSSTYTLGDMIQSTTGGLTSDETAYQINDTWTESLTGWNCIGVSCSVTLKNDSVYVGNNSIYFSATFTPVNFSLKICYARGE